MKDYKEILKGVIDIINTTEKSDIGFTNICTYIGENCPELNESEDERIRKELISFVENWKTFNPNSPFECPIYTSDKATIDKILTWLEKQSKQEPTDLKTWKYIVSDVLTAEKGIGQYLDDPRTSGVAKRLQERFGNIPQKPVDVKPHIPDGNTAYDKEWEEAQKYLSERGFDIHWNDGDVFVDERYIMQTVANVLAWGDEHPKQKIDCHENQDEACKIVWHSVSEEPIEDEELLCEWKGDTDILHDIAFYHADTKTFWNGPREIENVTKWAYVNIISQPQGETQKPNFIERYNDITKSEWFKETYEDKSVSEENVEPTPKFKIGDWVIIDNNHNSLYQIEKIENYQYFLRHYLGGTMPLNFSDEEDLRIWTIDYAKDGDILVCNDNINKVNCPFIFHNLNEESNPRSYGGVNTLDLFQLTDENDGYWCRVNLVKPATKEQRDTLFQKMKEAGYKWDAEKKKLSLT